MRIISGPKAINIIRPANSNNDTNNGGSIVSTTKKISMTVHESKKSTFSLFDPKRRSLPQQPPPPLKKPVIGLYKGGSIRTTSPQRSFSLSHINSMPQEKKYGQLSEKELIMHNLQEQQPKKQSIIPTPSNVDSKSISSSEYEEDHKNTTSSEESKIEEEDTHIDEELPELRIDRKIADLEISNQSLLIINEMLESTVRHQASFKQMMTFPNGEVQRKKDEQDRFILLQQQQLSDENEEDWEPDEQFNRLKKMTENMIEEAKKALAYVPETGGRVISGHHHHRRSGNSRRSHRHGNRHSSDSSIASSSSTSNQLQLQEHQQAS